LTGNVGAAPSFRTTPRGVQVGHFPFGVHETDETSWVHILTFFDPKEPDEKKRRRAEKLLRTVREKVKKGEELTVVGYPHTKEVQQKNGSVQVVQQLYLVAARHRQ